MEAFFRRHQCRSVKKTFKAENVYRMGERIRLLNDCQADSHCSLLTAECVWCVCGEVEDNAGFKTNVVPSCVFEMW